MKRQAPGLGPPRPWSVCGQAHPQLCGQYAQRRGLRWTTCPSPLELSQISISFYSSYNYFSLTQPWFLCFDMLFSICVGPDWWMFLRLGMILASVSFEQRIALPQVMSSAQWGSIRKDAFSKGNKAVLLETFCGTEWKDDDLDLVRCSFAPDDSRLLVSGVDEDLWDMNHMRMGIHNTNGNIVFGHLHF